MISQGLKYGLGLQGSKPERAGLQGSRIDFSGLRLRLHNICLRDPGKMVSPPDIEMIGLRNPRQKFQGSKATGLVEMAMVVLNV